MDFLTKYRLALVLPMLAFLVSASSPKKSIYGALPIGPGLWLQKEFVVVETYDWFLYEMREKHPRKYLPDSATWYAHYDFGIGIWNDHHLIKDLEQRLMPVIGLNEAQIAAFADWFPSYYTKMGGDPIACRLPSKAELDMALTSRYGSKETEKMGPQVLKGRKSGNHFYHLQSHLPEWTTEGIEDKGLAHLPVAFRLACDLK
ncbi:MAG: hypothetical protein HYZ16_04795 [Bacteroidetes bacterium]|jgi:hypothetical protein|nr:hypothetical protein [Bacteroidota bacterium]